MICDFAETYGVYDYRSLPVSKITVLLHGLRPDSRVMMKLADRKLSFETELQAAAVDRLSYLLWAKTQDGLKNRNKPKSIIDIIYHSKDTDANTFDSGEDFMAARQKLLKG